MAKIKILNQNPKEILTTPQGQSLPPGLINIFPPRISSLLDQLPAQAKQELEEIRVRLERPLTIFTGSDHYAITINGRLTKTIADGISITREDMEKILHTISQSSIYAWEEEFKRGYITLRGGHRIGLAGKVILDKGLIRSMKDISGLNFRIARELLGVGEKIVPFIIDNGGRVHHTLLVSPPQCGKTTLLRDMIRLLSNGIPRLGFSGVNIGLVDERSELAGSYQGIPQYNIGYRTDVLDGCPKAQGMIMLIRSMSPQVIATDEIGTQEDIQAMEEVLNAGISLLTTVHGRDLEDILKRPVLKKVIEQRLFTRIIILGRSLGVGTIEKILDGTTMEPIVNTPLVGRVV